MAKNLKKINSALEELKLFQGAAYFSMQCPCSYKSIDRLVDLIEQAVKNGETSVSLEQWADLCSDEPA